MSSFSTYNGIGNPCPQVGDVIRCRMPAKGLVGDAIYHVDCVHGDPLELIGLELSDREDGKGAKIHGHFAPWMFQLLRRGVTASDNQGSDSDIGKRNANLQGKRRT